MCATPLLLLTPLLVAQQPGPQGNQTPGQGMDRGGMYHQPEDRADRERGMDERQEMYDEREDLGELGLPVGEFWLNAELVMRVGITPDQVHRLADTYLQGRLKLIQLDANEQMEEAKLDALESAPIMDNNETLAQTDRLADARAASEKADAHLAFALRVILNNDQVTLLRQGYLHGQMLGAQVPNPHAGGQHSTAKQPARPPA